MFVNDVSLSQDVPPLMISPRCRQFRACPCTTRSLQCNALSRFSKKLKYCNHPELFWQLSNCKVSFFFTIIVTNAFLTAVKFNDIPAIRRIKLSKSSKIRICWRYRFSLQPTQKPSFIFDVSVHKDEFPVHTLIRLWSGSILRDPNNTNLSWNRNNRGKGDRANLFSSKFNCTPSDLNPLSFSPKY